MECGLALGRRRAEALGLVRRRAADQGDDVELDVAGVELEGQRRVFDLNFDGLAPAVAEARRPPRDDARLRRRGREGVVSHGL